MESATANRRQGSLVHSLNGDWFGYMRWRDAFGAVLDTRFYTLDWLDGEVWNGNARCWTSPDAAIIATLRHYPTGACEVHGLIAAGELNAIRALIPLAEQWGGLHGAIVASVSSKAAWQRALAPDGYHLFQVEVRKELDVGPQ